MSAVLKVFASMSASGGLLILVLLLGKRVWQDRISRQWQYYIWLVVIARLLLPFGPETTLLGSAYQAAGQAISAPFPQRQQRAQSEPKGPPADGSEQNCENGSAPAASAAPALLADHIWLAAALGLLIRKATVYQGFMRYIRAGAVPVSEMERLDRLSAAAEWSGVKRPVELCVNPLVSSPLLVGFFHPCIVLPSVDIPEKNFQYIALHELTHYKRQDLFYKWLVQVTVCLHWFNPLVHLMSREITRDCEFSCDEAVLAKVGCGSAQDYGKTLLDAMAAVGRYKENPGAVTLSENKQLLKERLGAIMNFTRKSNAVRFLTGALTLCIVFGAAFLGVYPAAASGQTADASHAAADSGTAQGTAGADRGRYSRLAEKYYEAGSLPLFQMTFVRLDEAEQSEWLDRIYEDGNIAFMGAVTALLDEDCTAVLHLAETIYEDGNIAFFSALAAHMSEETLEGWLDRALEDGTWAFQSMLFNALDWEDEFDELEAKQEKEWEAAQRAEYGAVGVTMDGKDYYYQGRLVNIFLDIRSNKSFYTLNMNPKGSVNIKIVRNENNEVTGAAYMTEAEIAELFGEEDEDGALGHAEGSISIAPAGES